MSHKNEIRREINVAKKVNGVASGRNLRTLNPEREASTTSTLKTLATERCRSRRPSRGAPQGKHESTTIDDDAIGGAIIGRARPVRRCAMHHAWPAVTNANDAIAIAANGARAPATRHGTRK